MSKDRSREYSEALRLENEALRMKLARLTDVSRRATESLELGTVLQEIADGARLITDAQYAVVAYFDGPGHPREFFASGIGPKECQKFSDSPELLNFLDHLNDLPEPMRIPDFRNHSRFEDFNECALQLKTFLGTPVHYQGERVGNIYLAGKANADEFTEDDQEALVAFASQAAVAIGNAISYQREQRSREDMEREMNRLEALVESSPVGVLVVDAHSGTFESVNLEAKRILGLDLDSGSRLAHYHDDGIFHSTDGQPTEVQECPISRALTLGETVRAEEIILRLPSGRSVTTLVNATPVYSESGEIASAVAIVQDMSPLDDLEKLRNGFLAMVSHELRAPLTTIKGCASMALSSDGAPAVAALLQYFRMIDQQSDHLNNLINNLLDITQIESGTLSVATRSEDVDAIIDEAKRGFHAQGGRNSVEVEITGHLVPVAADRQRIVQVLQNLLSNASKFSGQGSSIGVTAYQDEFSARISVADSGKGLTCEELPRLFKKFSRINRFDEAESVGGRGLGLAICKGIIEAHGGRIWAESEGIKQGSTFTFTIPLASPVHEADVSNSGIKTSGAGRKILTVDDEPQVLWLFRKILREHGFETVETGNTDDLLTLLDEERPNLVLMDLLLPGTSGLEQMRRIHRWRDVPVIFVSGNEEEENIVRP